MVEAILWDNDGVLVDTEGLFFQATRDALAGAGVELTLEQFLDLSMRQGRSAFDLVAQQGWASEQLGALKERRDVDYVRILQQQTRVLEGVLQTLRELQGSLRMAIVTSCRRRHFEVMHASTRLEEFFEFVLAREDYGRAKPDPEPYLLALERLGLTADQCVAIEDSERGLAAARAAGLRCLVIPNEMTRGCNFEGATAVLESAAAVPAQVAGLEHQPQEPNITRLQRSTH
jgi:HAD superfamily hydrolase (TIGR01509 family)